MTTPYEELRKTKVVYGRVTFQKKVGDLTLSKPGLSFTVSDHGAAPHFTARFRWSAIQKHFANKSKPMIKIKVLDKDGQEQGILFTMNNRDELEAFQEDLNARLPPPEQRLSAVMAPAVIMHEKEVEDSPCMDTYAMKKSAKSSNRAPPAAALPSNALVPVPPHVEIEEEVDVVPSQERAMVKATRRNNNHNPTSTDMTICTTTTAAYDDMVNMNGEIYGTSRYLSPPAGAQLVAEAELEDFAPCSCICYKCLVNDKLRKRTYVRVYENRIESNVARDPWCCGDERCMIDSPHIFLFDKSPNRVGMYCNLVPCVCCGPPVIYSKVPKACCGLVDLRECCGEQILHAQCDCFHLRTCLCCGPFCYQCWACPLFGPMPFKNGEEFLAKWKGALDEYSDKHGIDEAQRATFFHVEDKCCATDSGRHIEAIKMER